MKKFRAAGLLLLAPAVFLAAAHAMDVAAIDRDRIFQAAAVVLRPALVKITHPRAILREGGPNEFYSNGDYWWPNPNSTNGLPRIPATA